MEHVVRVHCKLRSPAACSDATRLSAPHSLLDELEHSRHRAQRTAIYYAQVAGQAHRQTLAGMDDVDSERE